MTSSDVLKKINESRMPEHIFIKWDRKESDFADYDLIERFVVNLSSGEVIGDIELLTMKDMWTEIKRITEDRVSIIDTNSVENVVWQHKGKSGVTTQICPYSPETLMTIFDVETKGNPIG